MGLAAIPTALLLGVTRHLATDIASFPLLWAIPLALFLLSFVIAFGDRSERRIPGLAVRVRAWSVLIPLTLLGGTFATTLVTACGERADSSADQSDSAPIAEQNEAVDRVVNAALSAVDTMSLPWPFIQSFMVNSTVSGTADPFVTEADPQDSPLDLLGLQQQGWRICTACADSTSAVAAVALREARCWASSAANWKAAPTPSSPTPTSTSTRTAGATGTRPLPEHA